MPKRISDHFRLNHEAFLASGAFDSFLDVDTRLFVDPFLLGDSAIPEFAHGRKKILKHFSDVMKLLVASKVKGDRCWTEAAKRLVFKEISGFGLGYSGKSTKGSGIGVKKQDQLLSATKEILDAGIQDPELFEIIGLLEDGIGKDNIGDMVCSILFGEFAAYTERVFRESGWVGSDRWTIRGQTYALPTHPMLKNMAVMVSPSSFLRTLPTASDFCDISVVSYENSEIRKKVNEILGKNWRKTYETALGTQRGNREIIHQNPEILRTLLASYKQARAVPYNFDLDPDGLVSWYDQALTIAETAPLPLSLPASCSTDDIYRVVKEICSKFRELVENNRYYKLFYCDEDCKKPRHEDAIQIAFYGIADVYCEKSNLNLTRESDGGRGPVDFKVSSGYSGSVLVEIKKSTNNHLVQAYTKQIPIYERADRAGKSIMLIVRVSDSDTNIIKLMSHVQKSKNQKQDGPEIIIINGTPVSSASHS